MEDVKVMFETSYLRETATIKQILHHQQIHSNRLVQHGIFISDLVESKYFG
jgi:hypothetical protein